jgi:hypothetical protein
MTRDLRVVMLIPVVLDEKDFEVETTDYIFACAQAFHQF